MICPICEQENNEENKYCTLCGHVLRPDAVIEPQVMPNRGITVFAGFFFSFVAHILMAVVVVRSTISDTWYRGGSSGSDNPGVILPACIVFLSIIPYVALRVSGQRALAKGVLWGAITFYGLILLGILLLILALQQH